MIFQGVKCFRGPNYQDFGRIIMTFFIILSGIWGKKYRFEKVYIYILKHPRVVNVEYALKYTAEIEKMDKLSGLSWLFSKIGTIIRDIMTKLANFDQISNYHDLSRIPRIPIELYTLMYGLGTYSSRHFRIIKEVVRHFRHFLRIYDVFNFWLRQVSKRR